MQALNLKLPLSEKDFFSILEYAEETELILIDSNGNDLPENETSERDRLADALNTEMSLHSSEDIEIVNLNKRLI